MKAFQPAAQEDPTLARGRYLVEGLGHCGACHTPRSFTMQEKALNNGQGNDYLAGSSAPIDGWTASNLRGDNRDGLGRWIEADLQQFLRYGRNDHTAAFGGMTEVVQHSLQYLSNADISAIARYLKSLGAKDPSQALFREDDAVARALWKGDDSQPGAGVYVDSCAACHKTDGSGYQHFYPALRGNPVVMAEGSDVADSHRTGRRHAAGRARRTDRDHHAGVWLASERQPGGGCGELYPQQLGQRRAGQRHGETGGETAPG